MFRPRAFGRFRVFLFLLLVASPATADERAEVRAAGVLDAFLAGWIARHPEQATRIGDHATDAQLPLRSPVARERDARWYAEQRDSLAALPLEALSPDRQIDVRLALDRAALEARKDAIDRLGARDPSEGLRELRTALDEVAHGIYAGACQRSLSLRARFRAVPEYLRNAMLASDGPTRVGVEGALDLVDDLLRLCREDLPSLFVSCRENSLQAELAVADSMTTRALARYAEDLRDHALPEAADGLPVGREAFAARLAAVAGSDVDLPALLDRARSEWNHHAAALTPSRTATLELQRIDADSAEVVLQTLGEQLRRERRIPPDLEARIDVSDAPSGRDGRVLFSYGPWDRRAGRSRLALGPAPAGRTASGEGALREDPMYSLTDARLLLAREAVPGRGAFLAMEARHASRVRQAFGLEAVRDGWSRYAEQVWISSAPDEARPAAERRMHRLERERLARAIAELMLRVESASVEEAAIWLERGAALSPAEAERAAREAALDPTWTASSVAFWAFEELRQSTERDAPGFDLAAFHDAIWKAGAVPTAWIADRVRAAAGVPGKP